ncbi:MAG: hydroxymethylglutaryl-CoA lyase [Rubrobacteraceae bacterium]|nr:hydroxymethylglutaryl-CoA lyase [Rubrobacteraceae bacterium]
MPEFVEVVEVGPRDGLQNEKSNVPTGEKVALIEALAAAGLRRFEATSFVSPRAIPQLADAESVLVGLPPSNEVLYGGLIPNERGYERAKAAGVGEVVIVGAATESYCHKNLNMSVDEALDGFGPIAARGRQDGIRVRANVSTVFGDPFEGRPGLGQVLRVVSRVVEAGIDDVVLSDTIGIANPRQVFDVFAAVREAHPGVVFGAHFHDTRGLAAANTVAALEAGISTFDSSVGGLGGSPNAPGAGGNAATEDLVYMLAQMGIETGVDLGRLMDAADLLERLVGHPLNTRIERPLLADPDADG